MRKTVFKKLIYLFLMIFFLSAGAVYILNSNQALKIIFAATGKITNTKLTAKRIEGCLAGPIKLEELYLSNQNIVITAKNLESDWKVSDLLVGKITILKLYVDDVNVKIKPETKSSNKKTPEFDFKNFAIKLPNYLALEEIRFSKIVWQRSDDQVPIKIDNILLQLQINNRQITKLFFSSQAQQAKLNINGSLQENWDLKWDFYLPNISNFAKNIFGKLEFTGEVYGKRNNPKVSATLQGSNFRYKNFSFAKLNSAFELNSQATAQNGTLNLEIIQPSVGSLRFDQINVLGTLETINDNWENLKAEIKIGTTKIFFPENNKKFLKIASTIIQLQLDNLGLLTKTTIVIEDYSPIFLELKLPKLNDVNDLSLKQPISGSLTWSTKNLNFLPKTSTKIGKAKGELSLNYTLSGTIAKPKTTGVATLKNGKINIPELNTTLKDINLNIKSTDNNLTYQAALKSGEGKLDISGNATINKTINSKTKITGSNFLAIDNKEYKAVISPMLLLETQADTLNLSGKVVISEANIAPLSFNTGNLLPTEIVYVDKDDKKQDSILYKLNADVSLNLGENVFISIMGAKGNLRGKIRLYDSPEKSTTATGTLYLKNGIYSIYGQELKISKGELQFLGGPVDNPQLNIEATRSFKPQTPSNIFNTQDSLTVGVKMTGMLNNSKIELFSIPAGMLKADILSYLIFGQSTKQVSGDKTQLLLKAASALNFGGSGGFGDMFGDFKETFQLDEIGFQTEDRMDIQQDAQLASQTGAGTVTSTTSFALGKYLSPKLYVGYSIGLTDPVNTLRVKYLMGNYWTIETESSTLGNGIDLFYNFKHD